MKFGIIGNKSAVNIGDDIQSFAISNFLPSVDYFIDREHLNTFKTDDGEPVAVVMAAWYMWKKWNWPPSKYIVPKLISMHYADYQIGNQPGGPVKYEFMTGAGRDYMNAYGPVGCRDMFTYRNFKERGIDCYFSGCVTLTLPKMPKVEHDKKYICAVDLRPPSLNKLKSILKGSEIELKVITHNKTKQGDENSEWEDTKKDVVELLTLYQNAKCVVTRRLHCALPCLAMDVPVFVINSRSKAASNRFEPYFDWLHNSKEGAFVNDEYDYDFFNPPLNNGKHIPTREKLIKDITEFVDEYKNKQGSVDEYVKITYTPDEVAKWQNSAMKESLDKWVPLFDELFKQIDALQERRDQLLSRYTEITDQCNEIFESKGVNRIVSLRNTFLKDNNKMVLPSISKETDKPSDKKKKASKKARGKADVYAKTPELSRMINDEAKPSVDDYRNNRFSWQIDTLGDDELNDILRNQLDEWSKLYRQGIVLTHRLENEIDSAPAKYEELKKYKKFTDCRSVALAVKVVNAFKRGDNKLVIPTFEKES